MSALLALLSARKKAPGAVTPPAGTPMPSTSDRRLNIARRDSGADSGWAAGDPSTVAFTDTITTMAHGRNPSLILTAGAADITYSAATLTDTGSGSSYPLTVGGASTWTVPANSTVETDQVPVLSVAGTVWAFKATATRASTSGVASPIATLMVAHSLTPSVLIIGDSNAPGAHHFAQAGVLAAGLPHANIAGSGNRVETYYAGGKLSDVQLTYHSHCLSEIGVNNTDWTVAQLGAGLIQLANRATAKGQKFYQCTICPRVTLAAGADWATVTEAQQTWPYPQEKDFNPWIRDGLPTSSGAYVAAGTAGAVKAGAAGSPFTGWVETAAPVETSLGSWKWIPNATGDGTHISTWGHGQISPTVKAWALNLTL